MLFGVAAGMERLSLNLTKTAKSSGVRECLEFVISGWLKMKIVWLCNANLEQKIKNLAYGHHWILVVVTNHAMLLK